MCRKEDEIKCEYGRLENFAVLLGQNLIVNILYINDRTKINCFIIYFHNVPQIYPIALHLPTADFSRFRRTRAQKEEKNYNEMNII